MKTLEQLISNIEDDMELFGRNHIVYLWRDEKTGMILDYDLLPDEDYQDPETLELVLLSLQKSSEEVKNKALQYEVWQHTADGGSDILTAVFTDMEDVVRFTGRSSLYTVKDISTEKSCYRKYRIEAMEESD